MARQNASPPMTQHIPDGGAVDPMLARGMRVTWWYTFGGIIFFEVIFVFLAASILALVAPSLLALLVLVLGSVVWGSATAALLAQYRRCTTTGDDPSRRRVWIALAATALYSVALVCTSGIWSLALMPCAVAVLLLQWPPGIRNRVTAAVTLLLVVLVLRDGMMMSDTLAAQGAENAWWFTAFYVCLIPVMSVFSLWWWDVVVRLDHARAAEGRLAATQERLRVATDVHDLQGHHLQVIALQLELAERLMSRDPAAASEQLAEARRSVDAARQGTRDLAKPFRGVPLPDEIENAADLLRAAGAHVETVIGPGAQGAPADVLGPVIRETTTNVLKHGGGSWAHLSLTRENEQWCYRIANDVSPMPADGALAHAPGSSTGTGTGTRGSGSGIEGMRRRVHDAGGSLHVTRAETSLVVTARVAAPAAGADAGGRA